MLICVALRQSQVIAVICNEYNYKVNKAHQGEACNYYDDALLLHLYATRTSFVPEDNLLVHEILIVSRNRCCKL